VVCLTRILFLLLGLRLLMPHGFCVCHLLDPQTHCPIEENEGPAAPAEEEDEHSPSCPASKTAGDYVPSPDCELSLVPALAETLTLPEACLVLAHAETSCPAPFAHPSAQPLYLTLRALLI
jgi:hypothetical protein